MILNRRSTREVANCKFNRRIVLLFSLLVTAAFQANADQFFLILDPYFYRSPVVKPIEGTKETVLAYYRVVDRETLAAAKPQELPEKDRSASTQQTIDHARRLLGIVKPEIIRDSTGVITALRLGSFDPTFSSILLLPDLGNRYADLLGPNCYFAVPNRQTILCFPRLATNIQSFAALVFSLYHNDPWPISTEIFEIREGHLRVSGHFNDDF
jgi:hypothetical protein